ncbi:hypothetical protein [Mycobacteroides abscessus]|nr:hypothetical protein [Mycobacteroides abscessus]MDB2190818.1 hypothetical protein [Mycobacteroides abscessus subsp. abscessus]
MSAATVQTQIRNEHYPLWTRMVLEDVVNASSSSTEHSLEMRLARDYG